MYAGLKYIPLIIAGLAGMAWGLPAAHRLGKPWDIAAACVVLAGVLTVMMGILLTCVPHFFR